jgi:hypothetical protein
MEIWKDIEGYEGLYQVSNTGKVKRLSGKNCLKDRILKKTKHNGYYSKVVLSKNGTHNGANVHRLVGMAFLDNPNNLPFVLHKDETLPPEEIDKVENLWWGTPKDNDEDKVKKGRQPKGIKHGNSVITEQDVIRIREFRKKTGAGYRVISKELNLSIDAVNKVLYGNSWKHVK